ncbi:MAG: hypothetical protein WAM14_14385 [Candidatus Nitrosopolaris sp.]
MSDKKKIQEPNLTTGEAKERELDEQPKLTRKVSHPSRTDYTGKSSLVAERIIRARKCGKVAVAVLAP